MAKKQAIIKRVEELAETNDDENIGDKVKSLISEWNSVGFVPFKEKDRLYKEFHSLVNRIFDKANLSAAERKLNTYKSGLNKEANLYKEREKLVRIYERIKTEIKTYENNLGFLSSTSKKGNSLLNDISRKIDKLKADLDLTQKKIDAIDETLNL